MAAILVVEDDADVAALLRIRLEGAGHAVLLTPDGEAGLAMAARGGFDVVILDWMLPGRTGIEVCQALRSDPGFQGRILMLTARANEADRQQAAAAGADEFVTKPFSPRELVARVADLLT